MAVAVVVAGVKTGADADLSRNLLNPLIIQDYQWKVLPCPETRAFFCLGRDMADRGCHFEGSRRAQLQYS